MKHILLKHAQRYPRMTAQDAVKLLYQSEFGPGHMIRDENESLRRLQAEREQLRPDPAVPSLEYIGNGLVRVNLAAWTQEEYPSRRLNADFVRSAGLHHGDSDRFLQKLSLLRDMTQQGLLPFSAGELDAYLREYTAAGCPAVSHSETYRELYRPAYRVVRQDCLSLSPAAVMVKEARRHVPAGRPLLIALDGRCASGKTTLAARLAEKHGWSIVHMDDFFLRPGQRTAARLSTPGENVDHERFLAEVLLPLSRGEQAQYRPFDCSSQTLGQPVRVQSAPVVLVEGSYSCHPALFPYYDLTLFLTIAPGEQMERIIARDGEEYARVFREKWIPLEEAYFSAFSVQSRCDLSFACGSAGSRSADN